MDSIIVYIHVLPITLLFLVYLYTVYKHHKLINYMYRIYKRVPMTEIDAVFEWVPVINLLNSLELIMIYEKHESLSEVFERYLKI